MEIESLGLREISVNDGVRKRGALTLTVNDCVFVENWPFYGFKQIIGIFMQCLL